MTSRRLLTALATAFMCTLLAAQTTDEPATEAASEPFFDVVNVEIVNIDVWVTDQDGNPVDGLGREDFEVRRDGEPVEIANFYAVAGGRPARGAPEQVAETRPIEGVETGATGRNAERPAAEHRLWLILFIDNHNLDALERNRILPALREFIARNVRAGDRAMVVSYGRALEVRQPFTDRASLLFEALDELRDDAGHAGIRRRELIDAMRNIDESDSGDEALMHARLYAEQQKNQVDYTADALQRYVDTLAGLPGRKALLHVSSGIPMLPGEGLFHAVGEKFGASQAYAEIPRHDASRAFDRVVRAANAHRVSFQTMDAGGLRGVEFGAAEYGGFVDSRLRRTLDSIVPENLQSPLRLMALETGGRAILNRNEVLPALNEMARDFHSFYSLGIASTETDTGRYHEIKVRLREKRKGVSLRHRAGYRSKSLDTTVREGLRSALLYSHQANPLDVDVSLGAVERYREKDRYILPIQLNVPMRDVVMLPVASGKHEARLKLFVGVVGKGGETSEIDAAPFGIRLANDYVEAAQGESLRHTHKLLVGPGRQKIGIAILDVFGSQSSVLTRVVDIDGSSVRGSEADASSAGTGS